MIEPESSPESSPPHNLGQTVLLGVIYTAVGIAVLAGLSLVAASLGGFSPGHAQHGASRARCKSNLKQIGTAFRSMRTCTARSTSSGGSPEQATSPNSPSS